MDASLVKVEQILPDDSGAENADSPRSAESPPPPPPPPHHIRNPLFTEALKLTSALDAETLLELVSPRLFDHFSIWHLMTQKAKLTSETTDCSAIEAILNDTASVLGELKLFIEACLTPVNVPVERRTGTNRCFGSMVEVDNMLSLALCLDSGVWKRREPEDIDYVSPVLSLTHLFPDRLGTSGGHRKKKPKQSRNNKIKEELMDDTDLADFEAETKLEYDSDDEYELEPKVPKKSKSAPRKRNRVRPTKDPNDWPTNKQVKKEKQFFTCEKCGKTYASATALYRHIEKTCTLRETMKAEFRRIGNDFFCAYPDCPQADKVFETNEDVDNHWADIHVRDEDKIIPCILCDRKFATLAVRRIHLTKDHEKSYKCKECDKEFFTKGNLNYHMRNHQIEDKSDGEKGEHHLCLKCGQKLCKEYGRKHEATCNGRFVRHPEFKKVNGEFWCTVSGCTLKHSFNSMYGLRKHFHNDHMRDDEKYFACDFCDEKFSCNTTRNRHVKTKHLKNYVCDICGKGFGSKDKMTSHRYVHTGEKPYGCDKCDYRATKKYNLDIHRQSKHNDFEQKNFNCPECDKQFVSMGRVRRHIQDIHAQGKEPRGAKKKVSNKPPSLGVPGLSGVYPHQLPPHHHQSPLPHIPQPLPQPTPAHLHHLTQGHL